MEEDEIVVFLDKYPASYGHVLVAPREHYRDIVETPPYLVSRIFIIARGIGFASMRGLGATGFRIMANTGASAGQEIYHFHVHVIPRYDSGSPGPIKPRESLREDLARELLEKYKKSLTDPLVRDMINGEK